jgi:hypothetical protein
MLIIIGSAVSLLVQWLKEQFGTQEYKTLGVLIVVSLVAAFIYTYLVAAGYWQTVAQVLVVAGAFYTFVIARFQSTTP